MRTITRCPACQTQFFVTEVQLNKHDGKVRCGQCLHVFDAKSQFVADTPAIETTTTEATVTETLARDVSLATTPMEISSEVEAVATSPTLSTPAENDLAHDVDSNSVQIINPENTALDSASSSQINHPIDLEWTALDRTILDENALSNADALNPTSFNQPPSDQSQEPFAEVLELSASVEEVQAFATEAAQASDSISASTRNSENNAIFNHNGLNGGAESPLDTEPIKSLNDITKLSMLADNPTNYFDDLAGKDKLATKNLSKRSHRWLWLIGALILLISAAAQSIYFLRDDIATYYPSTKPILVKACQPLGCSINLPKLIEWIVIDDSDMQEDADIEGVMHLSSRLINKAGFNLAYPNLELTLTDVEDNPILRRVFKPINYLPANTNVALGLKAGEIIKIKLAITTQGETVAGYRIFVSY
ncbi:MAG: DUF3426 domain-containing protein [Methylotenera sp.]|nr:DUF3426 domain-containing protein [Methylotenera sp.]